MLPRYDNYKAMLLPALVEAIKADITAIASEDETKDYGFGDRVFPLVAPAGTQGNIIVLQQADETAERSAMGIARTIGFFEVYVIADDYNQALGMAGMLAVLLEGKIIQDEKGYAQARFAGMKQTYNESKYIITLTVKLS